jgi:phospholipid N-methyltransferase
MKYKFLMFVLAASALISLNSKKTINKEKVKKANGNVLIGGLGLGLVIHNILNKQEVKSITIIEINKDLIELVKPKFNSDKIFLSCMRDKSYPAKGLRLSDFAGF